MKIQDTRSGTEDPMQLYYSYKMFNLFKYRRINVVYEDLILVKSETTLRYIIFNKLNSFLRDFIMGSFVGATAS